MDFLCQGFRKLLYYGQRDATEIIYHAALWVVNKTEACFKSRVHHPARKCIRLPELTWDIMLHELRDRVLRSNSLCIPEWVGLDTVIKQMKARHTTPAAQHSIATEHAALRVQQHRKPRPYKPLYRVPPNLRYTVYHNRTVLKTLQFLYVMT